MLIVRMGTGTSVLVFRSMLRAGVEGLDRSSMRNVRAANELMRAAAGQGQNKDGHNLERTKHRGRRSR